MRVFGCIRVRAKKSRRVNVFITLVTSEFELFILFCLLENLGREGRRSEKRRKKK